MELPSVNTKTFEAFHPCRGYDESGAPGLVAGAFRGFVGALVKPVAYLLETSSRVADSITAAVVGVPEVVPRTRPPRFVSATSALSTYNQNEVGDLPVLHCVLDTKP